MRHGPARTPSASRLLAVGRAGPPAPCGAHGAAWSHPRCPPCKATGLEGAPKDMLPGQRCPPGLRGESLLFLGPWWLLLVGRHPSSQFPRARRKAKVNGKLDSDTDVCPGGSCSSQTSPPHSPGHRATAAHAGTPELLGSYHQGGTGGLKSGQKVSCPGPYPLLLRAAVLAVRGGKGFTKQHRPVLKVTFRAAPAQLAH